MLDALQVAATIGLLTVPFCHLNRPNNADLFTLGIVASLSVFVSFVRWRLTAPPGTYRR
ncbi:hypothetical protein ACPEIF_35035 [Streptomyces sp. NPDC012600]|uniref:hypothetical protein n=1 Tax=Streptomyces sp. NPDC012600 TaxID=3415005 RepID=UPI003C2CB1DC